MNAALNWIAAPQASLPYAAARWAIGSTFVDAELAARLTPIVAVADGDIRRTGINRDEFWANLVPWSAGLSVAIELEIAQGLSTNLATLEVKACGDELALRAGPLRDAWEARGPGLWRSLRLIAREELPAPSASVVLVRPALGGGGVAYPGCGAIAFEAMLANPHRELPEVVRLGWLVAQLQFASPAIAQQTTALALLPAVLSAAEEVELACCDAATLHRAIHAWHLASDAVVGEALAAKLWAWWQSIVSEPRPLTEAIADFARIQRDE